MEWISKLFRKDKKDGSIGPVFLFQRGLLLRYIIGEFFDLIAFRIVEPVKVVRLALAPAVLITSLLITLKI
ncbi:hypothetical protein [Bartonella harrusi]|uniref:hypothetical protein n=1 Tax=Bartonella harrusi TaxID=2961895 RepID=UPI0020C9293E|nr:hypothetical protein [Bartonella harrusi]